MANQEIFCTVNSCYYYGSGDRCNAEKIQVKNNQSTLGQTRMEVGSIDGDAGHSNQTLCETFVPKGRGPKPGIARINA